MCNHSFEYYLLVFVIIQPYGWEWFWQKPTYRWSSARDVHFYSCSPFPYVALIGHLICSSSCTKTLDVRATADLNGILWGEYLNTQSERFGKKNSVAPRA